jgi:hypothetical protein
MQPTCIAARSTRDEFSRALNAGANGVMYSVGGADIRMDLFYRLVNYLTASTALVG